MTPLLLLAPLFAAQGPVDWDAQYGETSRNELAQDQIELTDGSFLVTGTFIDGMDEGIFATKYSRDGVLLWDRHFQHSVSSERSETALATTDDGAVLVGKIITEAKNGSRLFVPWLIRLDSQGDTVWDSRMTFTPDVDVDCSSLQAGMLQDGRMVVVASSFAYGSAEDRNVFTVSPDGQLLDQKTFPPIMGGWYSSTLMNDACPTPDGGFVVTGSTGPYPAYPFLWRFSPDGQAQWLQVYQNAAFAQTAESVEPCQDGSLLMTGRAQNSPQATSLLRVEYDGSLRWAKRLNAPNRAYSTGQSAVELADGRLLLLETLTDAVAAKDVRSNLVLLTADGTPLARAGIAGGSYATSMIKLFVFDGSSPEGYLITGSRNDQGPCQPEDLWIVARKIPVDDTPSPGVLLEGAISR